jgi:hypothetical protein
LDGATLPTSQRGEGQQHTSASISNHGTAAQGSEFRQGIAESGNKAMEVSTIETPLGAAEPWVPDAQVPMAQEVNGVQTLESNVSDKTLQIVGQLCLLGGMYCIILPRFAGVQLQNLDHAFPAASNIGVVYSG